MSLTLALAIAAASVAPAPVPAKGAPSADSYRARLAEDEVIYFLLPDRFENGTRANDRGGIKGDRLHTGYDPTAKGFYHGGDLKGLTERLDYIQGLGATAIWLAPIFRNKPVQGAPGQESAGYHGYWVTDFTTVDPHFGTEADFRALVAAAHARGMKVYMDIITNHTADVIAYAECPTGGCAYRSRANYPYQRDGLNPGFAGDAVMTPENFTKLTNPNYAYTVIVPRAEIHAKHPAWLNDPLLYHNRGDSTFAGESSTMGDFSGLDDLMTENPCVVAGFIDIYGGWIDRFGIDGFRIDTAKHVNPEFWAQFVPAMRARAAARGIPNFHIFGEVFGGDIDAAPQAEATRVAKLPSVLDFALRNAIAANVTGKRGTDAFARLFAGDALYEGGEVTARMLPTFTGNHDMGRIARDIRVAFPQARDAEVLQRVELAHAMIFGLRGVPTIYSGDEQGFAGDGGDQDAREDMFPSHVAVYNDNSLVGTRATTAQSNFDPMHPLYRAFARLAAVRRAEPALRRGRQLVRFASDKPGLLAVSRFDPNNAREVLVLFNTSTAPLAAKVEVNVASRRFTSLAGDCPVEARQPGSVAITLPPLGYAICASEITP